MIPCTVSDTHRGLYPTTAQVEVEGEDVLIYAEDYDASTGVVRHGVKLTLPMRRLLRVIQAFYITRGL